MAARRVLNAAICVPSASSVNPALASISIYQNCFCMLSKTSVYFFFEWTVFSLSSYWRLIWDNSYLIGQNCWSSRVADLLKTSCLLIWQFRWLLLILNALVLLVGQCSVQQRSSVPGTHRSMVQLTHSTAALSRIRWSCWGHNNVLCLREKLQLMVRIVLIHIDIVTAAQWTEAGDERPWRQRDTLGMTLTNVPGHGNVYTLGLIDTDQGQKSSHWLVSLVTPKRPCETHPIQHYWSSSLGPWHYMTTSATAN